MDYKLSVIVPVYNSSKYLKKCIDSILSQTFSNYELIIVDDGSTDESGEICDNYMRKHSNVDVIHIENAGVANARKIGVQRSHGEYLMFVDSDDWIDPKMFEKMYNTIKKRDCDIVSCEYFLEEENRTIASRTSIQNGTEYNNSEEVLKDILLYKGINVWLVNKIFKKELFNGIDFREGTKMGEDYEVLLQVLANAKRFIHLTNKFYHYRQHINSACHTNSDKIIDIWNTALKKNDKYKVMYPRIAKYFDIKIYLEEIGGLVLMCRSDYPDKMTKRKVGTDVRHNIKYIVFTRDIPRKYKYSALCIFVSPTLFCFLYKFGLRVTSKLIKACG